MGFTITMLVMASRPGCNGGMGEEAACGLAGCDVDESGDGVLTQPAKATETRIERGKMGFMVSSFVVRVVPGLAEIP